MSKTEDELAQALQDSRSAQNSPDSQYVLGYQALLQMRTAILRPPDTGHAVHRGFTRTPFTL